MFLPPPGLVEWMLLQQQGFSNPNILGPVVAATLTGLGAAAVIVGRFLWLNHRRSNSNETRLDRYGRVIFGDDDDATRPGVAVQVRDLSEKVDRLEKRVDTIDKKLDRICEKLDA